MCKSGSVNGGRCGSLGFQTAAEEPRAVECWCVIDDVIVGVWELIFHLLPRVFSLFVEGDVYWVDVASCVESVVTGVEVCVCDESEGFVLGYL